MGIFTWLTNGGSGGSHIIGDGYGCGRGTEISISGLGNGVGLNELKVRCRFPKKEEGF